MSDNQKEISQTIQTINEYYNQGFNIFPLKKNEKTPASKYLDNGSQNSTINDPLSGSELAHIFKKGDDLNVGAHTGSPSGFVVIDIDVSKNGGKDNKRTKKQARKLAKQLTSLFGDTRVHTSPSGGFHLFYEYDESLKNIGRQIDAFSHLKYPEDAVIYNIGDKEVTANLEDIDILAGNGYVVMPPSDTDSGSYEVADFSVGTMGEFPVELLKLLPKKDSISGRTVGAIKALDNGADIPKSNPKEKKIKARWAKNGETKLMSNLTKYMNAEAGSRHDNLVKICSSIAAQLPFDKWDEMRRLVDGITSSFKPRYDESDEREIQNAIEWAKGKEFLSRIEAGNVAEAKKTLEAEEASQELGITSEDYQEQVNECLAAMQKNNKDEPLTNAHNIEVLLRMHPKFRGLVRYDGFTEQITYNCEHKGVTRDHEMDISNKDPILNKLYIHVQKEFFPKASKSDVKSAAVAAGNVNYFDAYEDYMDSLKGEWDGKDRLHKWLHKVYDLPDDAYHRGISAQFIFAMVRRAYNPGAEFQRALFLSGEQGVGKTAAMNILAGDGWFTEFADELMGREFGLHIRGRTLIDLSEGETMRKSSITKLKQMITDSQLTLRGFHTEKVEDHPIRCVISITNNHSPLLDLTGNRRYWVVNIPLDFNEVGDLDWLVMNRDQIFAEAVHKYHQTKEIDRELAEKIEATEDQEKKRKLIERKRMLWAYEAYVTEIEEDSNEVGLAYVPREQAEEYQSESRMVTPLEIAIRRVLLSYDHYRAGHEDFFVSAEDVYAQVDKETLRQSRLGSYAISEFSKTILTINENLESTRDWNGDERGKRGFRFKKPEKHADKKLKAIKRLRANAEDRGVPSEFSGRKAIREGEMAAHIRYKREGEKYVPMTAKEIEQEMEYEGSVELNTKEEDYAITSDDSFSDF